MLNVSIYLLNTQDRTAEVIFQENIMDSKIANIPSYTTYNSINYNMTKIGDNLFAGNSVLTKIVIPFTIKSIGVGAFANCLLLEEIEYSGTMEDWAKVVVGIAKQEIILLNVPTVQSTNPAKLFN